MLASIATLATACASVLGLDAVSYSPPGSDAAAGTHWCEAQPPAFACQDFDEDLSAESAPFLGFSTRTPASMMQVAEAFSGLGRFIVDSDASASSPGSVLIAIRPGEQYEDAGLRLALLGYEAPQQGTVELEAKMRIEQGPVTSSLDPPTVYVFSFGIKFGAKQSGSVGIAVSALDLADVSKVALYSAYSGAPAEVPISRSIKRGDWVSVHLRYEDPGDGGLARVQAEVDGVQAETTARPGVVSGAVGLISPLDNASEWLVRYDNVRITGR